MRFKLRLQLRRENIAGPIPSPCIKQIERNCRVPLNFLPRLLKYSLLYPQVHCRKRRALNSFCAHFNADAIVMSHCNLRAWDRQQRMTRYSAVPLVRTCVQNVVGEKEANFGIIAVSHSHQVNALPLGA